MHSEFRTQYKTLDWQQGVPWSPEFGDVYFSREDGLAETEHVFLQGNDLPQRWSNLTPFTIGETGFGTGLNFLVTWHAWRQHRRQAAGIQRLHFRSVELHPVAPDDIYRCASLWPQLQPLAKELCDHYPPPVEGMHTLPLSDGLTLTLCWGEATEHLRDWLPSGGIDAWYLDGFAPSRNPEMWSADLFREVARLSHAGSSVATFTAAGFVRRGLAEVGFDIERRPGFGNKRERIVGMFAGGPVGGALHAEAVDASSPGTAGILVPSRAIVVGGGIAGCSVAEAMARRGCDVVLLEQQSTLATGASGNPSGILMPYPSTPGSERHELYWTVFPYARQLARRCGVWHPSGVWQLSYLHWQKRWRQLRESGNVAGWAEALDAGEIRCGDRSITTGALIHFPKAGWVQPRDLCQRLIAHAQPGNIEVRFHQRVVAIESGHVRYHSGEQGASSKGERTIEGDVVIVAGAHEAMQLDPFRSWKMHSIRGQISIFKRRSAAAPWPGVICYDGYSLPTPEGEVCLGATFDAGDPDNSMRWEDHQKNFERLQNALPEMAELLEAPDFSSPPSAAGTAAALSPQGRVAQRCSTRDLRPVIGVCPELEGVYVSLAHRSRGLGSAPLAAELIAAQICREPLPLPGKLVAFLDPARVTTIVDGDSTRAGRF